MAEILLSLTIIGVVAAITLPSLTGNINERTWNTQRKALYARMSQAIALMPALNGYGSLADNDPNNVAEAFVTDGLSKVLKINNICDDEHIQDCGIASNYTNMAGSTAATPTNMQSLNSLMVEMDMLEPYPDGSIKEHKLSNVNTKAAAFETQNGESVLTFYNPNCVSDLGEGNSEFYVQNKVCVNFVYDLNGNKGPNTVGKDIGFITALYPTDSVVVAPYPYTSVFTGVSSRDASRTCTTRTGQDYRIPSTAEVSAMFVNKNILGLPINSRHIHSSGKDIRNGEIVSRVLVWIYGQWRTVPNATNGVDLWCVKR